MLFCHQNMPTIDAALKEQVLTAEARTLLRDFEARAKDLDEWSIEALSATIKEVLKAQGARMPQLGIPMRVAVTGQRQTPAIDAVLHLLGRTRVLARLEQSLADYTGRR